MYKCTVCGHHSATKLGKCPSCSSFGTFIKDESIAPIKKKKDRHNVSSGQALTHDISRHESVFRNISHPELQRSFQQWVKQGGVYLLGGEPGIGKSTLILQIINEIFKNNQLTIAYFTGEENESQVVSRYNRLTNGQANNFHIYHATHFEDIITTTKQNNYDMIIVDSIQTIYSPHTDSAAWSANQVRFCSEKISEFCKKSTTTAFIIGHVTKGGEIAWPKYLEHIVDVVLYLEGDRFGQLRFLRSKKNRFGHTDDSAIFEMTAQWLIPVYDLKERIIQNAHLNVPGNVLTIGLDNGRPVIANVEVLLTKTNGNYISRNCVGVDKKRVEMIIAILQKYLKQKLYLYDIYVNVPGEFTFYDSGLDLAIAAAITSQYNDQPILGETIFLGELGLSGQIVKTKFHSKRSREIPKWFELVDYESLTSIKNLTI